MITKSSFELKMIIFDNKNSPWTPHFVSTHLEINQLLLSSNEKTKP